MDHYFYSNKYHADKETLITTGLTQSDPMLILNGYAIVVLGGYNIASLKRRQFIAEISYITESHLQRMLYLKKCSPSLDGIAVF